MADSPIRVTDHARQRAERRGLDIETALDVVRSPQQTIPLREFRQALVDNGRAMIRVLVALTGEEVVIVTMYKTSKVNKYWRP